MANTVTETIQAKPTEIKAVKYKSYRLNYYHRNQASWLLCQISAALDFEAAMKVALDYCNHNSFRFISLGDAIITIEEQNEAQT